MKAGALPGVTGRAGRLDQRDQGIAIAVIADRLDRLRVARGGAFVPGLLARTAEQVDLTGLPRATQRFAVHVGQGQDLARTPVLHDAGNEPALVKCDLTVVHPRDSRCGHDLDRLSRAPGRPPLRWAARRSQTNNRSMSASPRAVRRT